MKKTLSLLSFAALAASAQGAATIYLTADTSTIRKSTDSGATFAAWGATGSQFRGIAADAATGTVFISDRGAGTLTNRPFYARNSAGTVLSTATYDATGQSAQNAAGYYNGYAYQSSGSVGGASQSFGLVGFNGSALTSTTFTSATNGNWQPSDITFATTGSNNYMYYGGGSDTNFNRSQLNADGTSAGRTTVALSAVSGTFPASFNDYALTASGRVLTFGANGFWVSDVNKFVSNAISLSQTYAFSATESTASGDMGANARDFALLGNDIYAVSNTNIYRYTLNDTTGAITFVSANSHGFNSGNVQIAAIPEPSTALLGGLGMLALLRRRRYA